MSPALRTTIGQNDWSVGEVHDVAPQLISPAGAKSMANVLLDEDGNPYRRGGTTYQSKEWEERWGMRWVWDGHLLPGARTLTSTLGDLAVLDPDGETLHPVGAGKGINKSLQAAVLEDLLYIGGGLLYGGSRKAVMFAAAGTISVTNGSKVVTGEGTNWNSEFDAGMILHRSLSGERIYIVASIDSTTQLTLRDPYEGATETGVSYTLNSAWDISTELAPYGAVYDYVTSCANRLVFGSGRDIIFTEVNNPHKTTNSLGTANKHTVPAGAEIVGLETVGQTVLIFTTAGVWTLDGLALDITDLNGNPQHRLRELSSEIVLAGAAGIAGWGDRLVVPTADGIYLMDGISESVKISKPIERAYLADLREGCRPGGAIVNHGHYFLPIIAPGKSGAPSEETVRMVRVCRLDRPTRDRGQTVYPWTHFTGDGGEVFAYAKRASVDQLHPKLLGGQGRSPTRLLDCSGYFEPKAAIKKDADGSTFEMDIITRDFETGGGTENMVRTARIRYELFNMIDNPEITVSYSDGAATAEGETSFTLAGEAIASDGSEPAKMKINKRSRFIRLRIQSSGPAARCVLRSLELSIRPSQATRR